MNNILVFSDNQLDIERLDIKLAMHSDVFLLLDLVHGHSTSIYG